MIYRWPQAADHLGALCGVRACSGAAAPPPRLTLRSHTHCANPADRPPPPHVGHAPANARRCRVYEVAIVGDCVWLPLGGLFCCRRGRLQMASQPSVKCTRRQRRVPTAGRLLAAPSAVAAAALPVRGANSSSRVSKLLGGEWASCQFISSGQLFQRASTLMH